MAQQPTPLAGGTPVGAIVIIFGLLTAALVVITIWGHGDTGAALFGTMLAVATNTLSNLLVIAQTDRTHAQVVQAVEQGTPNA